MTKRNIMMVKRRSIYHRIFSNTDGLHSTLDSIIRSEVNHFSIADEKVEKIPNHAAVKICLFSDHTTMYSYINLGIICITVVK